MKFGLDLPVKVDLLIGPVPAEFKDKVRIKGDRRAKNINKGVKLHAHDTPEALGINDDLVSITVAGPASDGTNVEIGIYLPQPFTYALMKVKSFYDKAASNEDKYDNAGKHAWDVFRILSMITEPEKSACERLRAQYGADSTYMNTLQIIGDDFSSYDSRGTVKALRYALTLGKRLSKESVQRCLKLMDEIFLGPGKSHGCL